MTALTSTVATLLCLLLTALSGNFAFAGEEISNNPSDSVAADPHAKHRAMLDKPGGDASTSDVDLRNNELVTRNGDTVHFATDVVGDQIVVIDFVYTTCTTICPVISAIFQQVQRGLDERPDAAVRMISISVDPVRDTPQRLNEYAGRLKAGDDWVWLTGEKTSVDDVLRGLGAYSPNFEDHPSIVLVGDPQSGTWKRFFGFPGPGKILAAVDELAAARQVALAQK
jgi:protein SCO1